MGTTADDGQEPDAAGAPGPDPDELTAEERAAYLQRRRHRASGVIAAGMFGIAEVFGRKPREEAPIVVAAPDEPVDIDADGMVIPIDDERSMVSPPLASAQPQTPGRRTWRREGRR